MDSSANGDTGNTTFARMKKTYDHRKQDRTNASFVRINQQIIASSQAGSTVDDLVFTISKHIQKMNLVNLTTAIHRLGKMVANDANAQAHLKQSSILSKILPSITRALSSTRSNQIQPQALSNILWSLASIRHADSEVISLIRYHSIPNMHRFKTFELSLLLWAFAKLSTVESSLLNTAQVTEIFGLAAKYVQEYAVMMDARNLSMVVWAFATAKQSNASLFAQVAEQIANGPTPTCQEMATTIWAYGTQNIMNRTLFESLAQKGAQKLTDFKAQEISNMLWGFASAGFFHEPFYQRAATVALSKDLSSQHVANILWAFTRVRPRHPLTQWVVSNYMPLCRQHLRNFKPQEVSSVALSIAKAFVDPHCEMATPIPSVVLDFFGIVSKGRYKLADFSTQSLTNMASAFAMVQLIHDAFLVKLGQEAVRRAYLLEPVDLFRIFQVFLSAQTASTKCAKIASSLVPPLANKLNCLRPYQIKALSHRCADVLRDAQRQDLLEQCSQIGCDSVRDMLRQCSDTEFPDGLKDKDVCFAQTYEPMHNVPGFSDCVDEYIENHTFGFDTDRKLAQQASYVHGLVLSPPPENMITFDYGIEMSKESIARTIDPYLEVAPMTWALIAQRECDESSVTPAEIANGSKNPMPPPSSLLWDVAEHDDFSGLPAPSKTSFLDAKLAETADRTTGADEFSLGTTPSAKTVPGHPNKVASSLRGLTNDENKPLQKCMHDLQQQADSASIVVVKNIEYQPAGRRGISAVQFSSETLHRQRQFTKRRDWFPELLVPDDAYDTEDGF
jgi:hypothetical protein